MKLRSKPRTKSSDSNRPRRRLALWRSERGQSLMELSLLAPVLLVLVIGLVEMGRYASLAIEVGNAARAGAQYGAQSLANAANAASIRCAAENESLTGGTAPACPSTNPLSLTVNPTNVCGCDNGGTITAMASCTSTCAHHVVVSVQVQASGTFSPLFTYPAQGLFGYLNIPSITVSDTATERVAQ
jgi:Flp pilus assembly protein TadG